MAERSLVASLSPLQQLLVEALADGRFYSGEQLGRQAGVSRAAVWKAVKGLPQFGLQLQAVRGRGYRLAQPLELLQAQQVLRHLAAPQRDCLTQFELLHAIDSTNAHLMRQAAAVAVSACVAEYQTAGRGRRGRCWISPFGSNIYLSLRWRFDEGMARLSGLSLAAAVAVLRTLHELDVTDATVKWPNDIYWAGRKLGGILLEVAGESAGPCHVVVGIGLNVAMPAEVAAAIDQPWVDLRSIRPGLSRNQLTGRLLHHLLDVLMTFQAAGLNAFVEEWRRADLLDGRRVALALPDEEISGISRGVDRDGALLLEVAGRVQRFTYGEVSLRLQEPAA